MALRLYMDVHIPKAITEALSRYSFEIITAQEDGSQLFEDEELLERTVHLNCLFFTQDEDFLSLATQWQALDRNFHGLIYCHQLRCGIGEIVEDLCLILSCATSPEMKNQVVFLPL
jgi:predicted nuclease of predicted toxin-antitoxin system